MRFLAPRWGLALLCPLLAATWYLTRQPTTVALFTYPLSPQDTIDVRTKLDELGFTYSCQDGNFQLPSDQVQEARAGLARFHLPRHRLITKDSHPKQHGWDELNSQHVELWNGLAAEGEMVVALRGCPAIEDAWVQTEPEQTSVLLKLERPLTEAELDQVLATIGEQHDLQIHDTEGRQLWPR